MGRTLALPRSFKNGSRKDSPYCVSGFRFPLLALQFGSEYRRYKWFDAGFSPNEPASLIRGPSRTSYACANQKFSPFYKQNITCYERYSLYLNFLNIHVNQSSSIMRKTNCLLQPSVRSSQTLYNWYEIYVRTEGCFKQVIQNGVSVADPGFSREGCQL